MRVVLAFLSLAPLIGVAADRLDGTWRSDHDTSMEFAKSHTILEPRQREFLDGVLGRLELSFDGTKMRYHLPTFVITTATGAHHDVFGTTQSFSYRVLGADDDSVAVLVAKYFGRDRILHIHFVNNDTFWLYSEETDFGLNDLNFREYFQRAK